MLITVKQYQKKIISIRRYVPKSVRHFFIVLGSWSCLRSYFKNSCLVFHRGFQTLENNKSIRPTASSFHQFSRVWKPRWNTRTRFWNMKLNHSFSLSFGGQPLTQSNLTKFLGVYLDEHFTWKYHINFVCKQIAKSIGILSRTRFYLSCKTKLMLYYTLIYPYIT